MFGRSGKGEVVKNIRLSADEISDDLQEAANRAGRKVREVYDSASDEIVDARDTLTTEIRKNPIRSSFIALGLGVLVGALLRK